MKNIKKIFLSLFVFLLVTCGANQNANKTKKEDTTSSYPVAVYFDFNSKVLNKESKDVLTAFAKVLNADNTLKVLLTGHTDDVGNEEYNYQLGLDRAEVVKAFLVKNGVNAKKITTESLGLKNQETFKNKSQAEVRSLNRKTIIEVSK